MRSRRLLAYPVTLLIAALLVGAIVDAGERTRRTAAAATAPWRASDPLIAAEGDALARVVESATRCFGAQACGVPSTLARLDAAATQLEAAAPDVRFLRVRESLAAELRAEVAIIRQRAASDADRRRTPAEAITLEETIDAWEVAAHEAVEARFAVGLVDEPTRDLLASNVEHRAGDLRRTARPGRS